MQEKQNIRVNILVLFCALALYIETTELGARVYYYGWDILRPSLGRSIPYLGNPDIFQSSPIGLLAELKPNIRTRFRKVILETNSQGLRDREYSIKKPARTFRVAVIGDSFTMPSGVTIEDAYHTLLEERLNAQSDTFRYEFINFGTDGYSLRDYLLQLQHIVPPYEPDLVLIGFMPGNDTQKILPSRQEYIVPASNFWAYLLAVVRYGKNAIHPQVRNSWNAPKLDGISPNPRDEMIAENEPYLREMFAKIATETTAKGIPVIVANLEYKTVHPKLLSLLQKITAEHGMSFTDTSVHFKGIDPLSLIIYRADGHANAKANRIFADVIYNGLIQNNLLPSDARALL